jgi:hypothetical protein
MEGEWRKLGSSDDQAKKSLDHEILALPLRRIGPE